MSIIGDGIVLGAGGETASIFVTGLSETDTVKAVLQVPGKVPNPDYVGLPDGYTQLKYIESTGTQYIHLTSVSAQSPVDMKLHISNFNGGFIVGKSSNGYGGFLSNSLYRPFGRTDYQFSSLPISSSKEHHVELGYDYIIIDGVSYSGSSDHGNTVNGEVTLFAGNDSSGRQYASGRIHYAEATQGGFHCVMYAVRRNADGVLGLYDTIHDVLYTNSGSGSFLAGPEMPQYIEGYVDGKVKVGKWTQKLNPAFIELPAGYTQLEYIESTGTQYINTLLSLPRGWRIKGKLLLTSVTTDSRGIFGAQAQNGSVWARNQFESSWGANNWFVGIGGYQYGGSPQANVEYEFDVCNIVGDTSYIKINGENVALTTGQADTGVRSDLSCYLFNAHISDGTNYFGQFRMIGKWEVYNENHNLVGNYIPAKRNSDGKIAVYDLVTQNFLQNAGTGEFVSGPEVPHTLNGFLIDKIKDYGTWTVTATDGAKTATQDILVDSADVFAVEIAYKLWLYRDYDECEDVTGGWVDKANNSSYGYFKKQSNYLEMGCSSASYYYEMGVSKNIDISGYTKAYVDLQFFSGSYSLASYSRGTFRIGGKSTSFSYGAHSGIDHQNLSTNRTVLELDISEATETHLSTQSIVHLGANGQIKVYRIWLE